jgi:hypothetical protein
MLIKNLPKGEYSVYLYLPGLKTKFMKEPRVCSIYDILVECKKSRSHFREKEIINTAEIREDGLDLPVTIPHTLDSDKYIKNEDGYINYSNEYYLRKNVTQTEGEYFDLYNSISFEIKEESLVEFYVAHNILKEKLQISILGFANYNDYISVVLKPGNYIAMLKVENLKKNVNQILQKSSPLNNSEDIFDINSLEHVVLLYIGMSRVSRVNEIYTNNNMLSTYHQCRSMSLPQTLDYDNNSHSYNYHSEFFTYNRESLQNLKIGSFSTILKTNNNRILVELGSDYVLNKLSLVVKSEHKSWKTSWLNNVGDLDITVPSGAYHFELEIDEKILLTNLECIIFSIDIHIIDNDYINTISDTEHNLTHPVYFSHKFDSSAHSKSKLLKPKCEGSVLPLELHKNADTDYHKIRDNGDYLLHIQKATYFINKQKSKNNENLNEVDINLANKSLVRIVTTVEKPNEFQILAKMKFYNKNDKNTHNNNYYLPYDINQVSHNLKERNIVWFLDSNKSMADDFYSLELIQEKYEELLESSLSYHCPVYTLDILIQSVNEVANRMECIQRGNNGGEEILEYTMPNLTIPNFKKTNKAYHEKIEYSYFTEKQYGDSYVINDDFKGLQYLIKFEIEEESEFFINITIGYDQVISLFDVYLSLENNDEINVVAASEPYFDKSDQNLPYKRILNHKLSKGKYIILIVENMWEEINRNIKAHAGVNENSKLC